MHCEWQPLLGLVTRYMGDAAGRNASCVKTSLHWLAQSLAAHADPHRITLDTVERFLFATRLATVQQQYLRAAMLFGVAEATRSATQTMLAQPMRALADAALATVHAALEPAAFAEAFAAGQAMRFEEAQTILFMTDRLKA